MELVKESAFGRYFSPVEKFISECHLFQKYLIATFTIYNKFDAEVKMGVEYLGEAARIFMKVCYVNRKSDEGPLSEVLDFVVT